MSRYQRELTEESDINSPVTEMECNVSIRTRMYTVKPMNKGHLSESQTLAFFHR